MRRLSFFKRLLRLAFLATVVAGPAFAQGDTLSDSLSDLRQLDGRVATIGHRLAVTNADLCRERQWLPGFVAHDLSQYGPDFRAAANQEFSLERGPGILALADDGPAMRAGVRRDDILLSVDGLPLPRGEPTGPASFAGMTRILDQIERAFADGSAALMLGRGDLELSVVVAGDQGCASRFQLIPSRRLNALADGRYVQVTSAIADYVADEQELAAVLAHELAHNVLRHKARLDAAGVERGFLGNFGRNARLIRETEEEADRLSIYLLDRAGYDIEAPVRFWQRFGRRGLNVFGSPTHGGWQGRVASFQDEIAAVRRARAAGEMPTPPNFAAR